MTPQPFIAWWPIVDEDQHISDLIAEASNPDNSWSLLDVALDQGCVPVGERRWTIGTGPTGQPLLACRTWAIPAPHKTEEAAA